MVFLRVIDRKIPRAHLLGARVLHERVQQFLIGINIAVRVDRRFLIPFCVPVQDDLPCSPGIALGDPELSGILRRNVRRQLRCHLTDDAPSCLLLVQHKIIEAHRQIREDLLVRLALPCERGPVQAASVGDTGVVRVRRLIRVILACNSRIGLVSDLAVRRLLRRLHRSREDRAVLFLHRREVRSLVGHLRRDCLRRRGLRLCGLRLLRRRRCRRLLGLRRDHGTVRARGHGKHQHQSKQYGCYFPKNHVNKPPRSPVCGKMSQQFHQFAILDPLAPELGERQLERVADDA